MAECFIYGQSGGNGSNTSITYGENLFNYEKFKEAIENNIHNGTIDWDDTIQGFTLTANSDDCYTEYMSSPRYIVDNTAMYELSFDCNGGLGIPLIFLGGYTSENYIITIPDTVSKKIFSPTNAIKNLTLRFGVSSVGDSRTYSNIQLREVISLGD